MYPVKKEPQEKKKKDQRRLLSALPLVRSCLQPSRAWVSCLPSPTAHSTPLGREDGMESLRIDKPSLRYRESLPRVTRTDYHSGILLSAIPGSSPNPLSNLRQACRSISPFHPYSDVFQNISQKGGSNISVTPTTWPKAIVFRVINFKDQNSGHYFQM